MSAGPRDARQRGSRRRARGRAVDARAAREERRPLAARLGGRRHDVGGCPRARCAPRASALGVLAHAILPSARRLASANVALAFPELELRARRDLVARTYRTLGGYLGDAVAMLDPRRPVDSAPLRDGRARDARRGRRGAARRASSRPRISVRGSASPPRSSRARCRSRPSLARPTTRASLVSTTVCEAGEACRTIYRGLAGAGAALLRTLRRGRRPRHPDGPRVTGPEHRRTIPRSPRSDPRGASAARAPDGRGGRGGAPRADRSVGDVAPALELTVTRIEPHDLEASPAGERVLTDADQRRALRAHPRPARGVGLDAPALGADAPAATTTTV